MNKIDEVENLFNFLYLPWILYKWQYWIRLKINKYSSLNM